MRALILIEAVGKIASLSASAKSIGLNADIIATKGHLYRNPDTLHPIGITEDFQEQLRGAVNPKLLFNIKNSADKYDCVLIATDPDQEGDVIASDIARLLPGEKMLRLKLQGMDDKSLMRALNSAQPFEDRRSWPGTTRRIVDRVIGATLSKVKEQISIGRIKGGILGLVHGKAHPFAELTLIMKDRDGGQDFVAKIPVTGKNHREVATLEKLASGSQLTSTAISKTTHLATPWNYADTVIECADRLKASTKDVSDALQRLYEQGDMSYPRTTARAIGEHALDCLSKISDHHGTDHHFDFRRLDTLSQDEAHESPRPIGMVDISMPLQLIDFDKQILSLIARNLIKSGIEAKIEKPDTSRLPEWAQSLPWQRVSYPTLPWKEPGITPGLRILRQDVALLKVISGAGLGRPSTQVRHASVLHEQGLINDRLELTPRGIHAFEATPIKLRDPEFSKTIEHMINEDIETPPSQKVEDIIDALGEDIAGRIYESLIESNVMGRSHLK